MTVGKSPDLSELWVLRDLVICPVDVTIPQCLPLPSLDLDVRVQGGGVEVIWKPYCIVTQTRRIKMGRVAPLDNLPSISL